MTYQIHEEDPSKPIPIETGINYYVEQHRPIISQKVQEAIDSKKPWDEELQIKTPTGKVKWVRAIGHPIVEDGKVVGLEGTFQDIDSKKRDEQKTSDLNRRLTLALKASNVGVWEWDIRSNELIWDNQMVRLYGLKDSEFSGAYSAWENGLHPDDKQRAIDEINAAVEGKSKFDTEFRVVWPNGEIRTIRALADVSRDEDNNPIKMIGVNWDITRFIEQQKLLQQSNNRYNLMAEGASVGIWDWLDVKKDEEFWSDKFYSLLGYQKDELEPSVTAFKNLLHPDDIEKTFAAVNCHFEEKKPFDIEYRLRTKSGNYRWFRGTGKAVFDKNNHPIRMVGSIADIDDLKKSQQEIESFIYTVSHDLKAPLVSIKGFLGRLKKHQKNLEEKSLLWLDRITANVNHMRSLLDDLLEISRVSSLELKRESVSFEDLVQESLAIFSSQIEENNVEVIVNDLPPLVVDPDRMRQVIVNLVGNAIKYNDKGAPRLEIGCRRHEGRVEIYFCDNGPGIPKDYHTKIFQIFERIHPEETDGTGLGLAICKQIIEKHDGKIWVINNSSKEGSTFSISLPVEVREEAA